MPMLWVRVRSRIPFIGDPVAVARGPSDARCIAKGALCADHFRIWRTQFDPADPADPWRYTTEKDQLRGLALPSCAETEDPGIWASFTVDHVAH
jgi:hypothetical protein